MQSPLDVLRTPSRFPLVAGGLGAALVHGVLLTAAAMAPAESPAIRTPTRAPAVNELVEVEPPPAPPPPPPPPAAAPEPEPPAAAPPPKAAAVKRVRTPEAAAPAAAAAAKVLDRAPTEEVLDFGDTFVQGEATSYAGGVTEAGATSKVAVRDPRARAYGVEGGRGEGAVDLSRAPSLAEGTQWDCPFPDEADDEGLDSAVVGLKVRVAADGTVERVDISQDPGNGFGREARRCALRKRWQAGRDRAGNPIAATRLLNVRFDR